MTAITFPLKKFPGQLKHESIVFTGRAIAQPVILSISLISQMLLAYTLEVSLMEAMICSLPLLFLIVAHVMYLLRMKKSDSDYFDMSLAKLRMQFSNDKAYFNMICNLGVVISMSIIVYAYIGEAVTLLLLSTNSSLLSLMYCASVFMGLYSKKRIASYVTVIAVLEILIMSGLLVGAYFVFYSLNALIAIHYFRVRTTEHSLTRLLQIIIK